MFLGRLLSYFICSLRQEMQMFLRTVGKRKNMYFKSKKFLRVDSEAIE